MLEKLIYRNHLNEELDLGNGGMYISQSDIHNYSWDIVSKNDKISAFKKGIKSFTLPVIIVTSDNDEATVLKNRLFEICEKDVLAKQYGKIIIGDYYMDCYITASSKKFYLRSPQTYKTELTISTDRAYWVKELLTVFDPNQGSSGSNLDYNNDFPYDYTSNIAGTILENPGITDADFVLKIHGACTNPKVTIGGHDYQVNTTLLNKELIVIDSKAKTVTKISSTGVKTNLFNLRNKQSYIFQKIPVGSNTTSTNSEFVFDVTILNERSEPEWI